MQINFRFLHHYSGMYTVHLDAAMPLIYMIIFNAQIQSALYTSNSGPNNASIVPYYSKGSNYWLKSFSQGCSKSVAARGLLRQSSSSIYSIKSSSYGALSNALRTSSQICSLISSPLTLRFTSSMEQLNTFAI